MSETGRLERIYLRPSARTPVREVEAAEAKVGSGLAGDHARGGKREVTLISREAWERACEELGEILEPSARRANLLLGGVDLAQSRGRKLQIGGVVLEINGETKPCQLMDDTRLGLWDALKPEWRGGVYARVLTGGELRVGDSARLLPVSLLPAE